MGRCVFRCLALALVVFGVAAPADAQSFKWWTAERFRAELALSPEQTARLEEIYQAATPTLKSQKDALEKLQADMKRLVAEGRADEATAAELFARVEAARGDLGRTRSLMLYRMRRILTSDQHLKLKVLFDEHERERRKQPRGQQ